MLDTIKTLNLRWETRLGEPLLIGIGINTGTARVGNVGSSRKFKYGPLGNAVNLASRIQGATKFFKTWLLISGDTRKQLPNSMPTRRIGKVAVVNIDKPVELYELIAGEPSRSRFRADYEEGLLAFENRDFRRAANIMGNLLESNPDDGPALVILSRAVHILAEEPAEVETVWKLPGK